MAGTWSAPKDGGENGAPLRLETEHFAFYWKDGTNITDADAKAAGVTLESIWDKYFSAPINFPEPYCASSKKWKAAVHFDNSFPLLGGAWSRNGINYAGMWVGPGAAKDNWGLAHEFMHGVQSLTPGFSECGGQGCWILKATQIGCPTKYTATTCTVLKCWSTRPIYTTAIPATATATGNF